MNPHLTEKLSHSSPHRLIRRAPQVARGERAMWRPAPPEDFEFFRLGHFSFAIGHLKTAPHAEVVNRQHVGSAEIENEEHLHGPAPDAFHAREPLDEFGVSETIALGERGHDAVERLPREVEEVAALLPRHARGAQGLEVQARDGFRAGKFCPGKKFLKPPRPGCVRPKLAASRLRSLGLAEGFQDRDEDGFRLHFFAADFSPDFL